MHREEYLQQLSKFLSSCPPKCNGRRLTVLYHKVGCMWLLHASPAHSRRMVICSHSQLKSEFQRTGSLKRVVGDVMDYLRIPRASTSVFQVSSLLCTCSHSWFLTHSFRKSTSPPFPETQGLSLWEGATRSASLGFRL